MRSFPKPKHDLTYFVNLDDPEERIIVAEDNEYWYQDKPKERLVGINLERLHVVNKMRSHLCEFGDYPWDLWYKWALEDGLSDDLAQLGRSLIREADQHSWPEELQKECGWYDSGAVMLEFAKSNPQQAEKRWDYLMETDGERVDPSDLE